MSKQSWDIFCQVIDNYGDIGVCWRLAKQLANEYPVSARLWVDEIDALMQINPLACNVDKQTIDGVEICIWQRDFKPTSIADTVIEAFACELPENYLIGMVEKAKSGKTLTWLNLEYLSAEAWVDDCHQVNSFHQATGLTKAFFFPGFSDNTGGLIREANLFAERDRFRANLASQNTLLAKLGINRKPQGLLVSLFSYENAGISSLLSAWQVSETPINCFVTAGKTLASVNQQLKQTLKIGQALQLGNLTLVAIPFLNQLEYDRLLWLCDINFVRGEDSFVRAQWSAKPMIWQIYPQQDEAHSKKLQAFLDAYLKHAEPMLTGLISAFWHSWNRGEAVSIQWSQLMSILPLWEQFSENWCRAQSNKTDLAANLVNYSSKKNSKIS